MKCQREQNHSHIFIVGLVYPAFLGAFLYEAVQRLLELINGEYSLPSEQYSLPVFLIFVFVFDFLYTADNARRKIYNSWRMIIDLFIVALLYTSLKLALEQDAQNFSYIWLSLASFKFCSLLWELPGKADEQKCLAILSSGFFSGFYLAGWFLFKSVTWALIIFLGVDMMIYLLWKIFPVDSQILSYKKRRSSRPSH